MNELLSISNVYLKVEKELRWLNNNYFHFNVIRDINIKKTDETLGCKIRIKDEENFYKEIYDNAIKNKNFSIMMQDESILSLFYVFDASKRLIEFSLSFIPNPYIDEYTDIYERYKNYNFKDIISQYLRFDMTFEGTTPFMHSTTHFHSSLNKNGCRLPLKNIIYPKTFLWIVSKYIYNMELYEIDNEEQLTYLTKDELKGLVLSIDYTMV